MRLPLYCKTCDMLTGHETISSTKARCRKCHNVRNLPIHRWILLLVIIIVGVVGATWMLYGMLKAFGLI
jgi:hypothetical protein